MIRISPLINMHHTFAISIFSNFKQFQMFVKVWGTTSTPTKTYCWHWERYQFMSISQKNVDILKLLFTISSSK